MTAMHRLTVVLLSVASLFCVSTLPAQESQVTYWRQRADELDTKIRQAYRDIAATTDKAQIAEQNRLAKEYEMQKTEAIYQLYLAQERTRKESQLASERALYRRAVETHNREVDRQDADVESHNRDAQNQRQAVQAYKSLSPQQRSQAEYERLTRWYELVKTRKGILDERSARIHQRKAELDNWKARLQKQTELLN